MFSFCLLSVALFLAVPRQASCADCLSNQTPCERTYVYPVSNSTADVVENCEMMPWMVGCSVWGACLAGHMSSSSPYCDPFSILGDICTDGGMSGMVGCKTWIKLCETSSGTDQCQLLPPIPKVVDTTASQIAVVDSCSQMSMIGCEDCIGPYTKCPDALLSLQTVCTSMYMEMCVDYTAMCTAAGSDLDYFCPGGADGGGDFDPPMRMYFHTGFRDIVLFRKWVPETGAAYFGTIVAVVLMGVFVSAIRAYRACSESYNRIYDNIHIRQNPQDVWRSNIFLPAPGRAVPHLQRSALTFVMITVDYSLMLIAMTFNVGIFFAVCGGLALGVLLFGHIPERYSQRLQARAIMSSDVACGCGPNGTPKYSDEAFEPTATLTTTTEKATAWHQPPPPTNGYANVGGTPPETQQKSCCGGEAATPEHDVITIQDCCQSESSYTGSASSMNALIVNNDSEQRMKICCTMKPILDVEDDTQISDVEQAGNMVPMCCRL